MLCPPCHPAHPTLFFWGEKLAILKSVLKCSSGNSASVPFFVQSSGRTRQHLALGLTNARLLSYQYTAREEQEHSSTLAKRLLKNMVWVGGKASSGGLLADTPLKPKLEAQMAATRWNVNYQASPIHCTSKTSYNTTTSAMLLDTHAHQTLFFFWGGGRGRGGGGGREAGNLEICPQGSTGKSASAPLQGGAADCQFSHVQQLLRLS